MNHYNKENMTLNQEKDQAILKIKNSFMCRSFSFKVLDKMEELQQEVEVMKQKQNEKSASYKKVKQEYIKLKAKNKKDVSLLNKFSKKFENDLAFARNWVLSFERDLSNLTSGDKENLECQIDEYLNNSMSYAQNMKAFISQIEKSMDAIKNNKPNV